ncbi:MAG: hypothetical protein QOE70_3867 [Chthoniobacter sp.]|jgi:inosine-uridine nucleoside N-ribohydrolase|nr:hypothetical protein [Chthoniobacter sp.]
MHNLAVWIDTDPSIGLPLHDADDGFALIQAFHSPELVIRGIASIYGNARLRRTDQIAREIARLFGPPAGLDANDVYPGAASAAELGQSTPAAEALQRALRESAGPLTCLALGPLTNLATVIQRAPGLAAEKIERVIFVGGRTPGSRFFFGSWNPYEFHDANFEKDPEAAAIVLGSRLPVTFVPLELTSKMALTPADFTRISASGEAGRWLAGKARLWLWLWRICFGVPGGLVHDCLAVLAATHPHLLCFEPREASIVPVSPTNRLPLLLARVPELATSPGRTVTFCRRFQPGAKAVLLDRLCRRAGSDTSELSTPRPPPASIVSP